MKIKMFFCVLLAITVLCASTWSVYATEIKVDDNLSSIATNDNKIYVSDLIPKGENGFLPQNRDRALTTQQNVSRSSPTDPGEIDEVHYLETTDGTSVTSYILYDWSDEERYQVHLDEVADQFPNIIVQDYPTYAYNDIAYA